MKVDIQVQSSSYSIRDPDPNDSWDIGEEGLHVHGVSVVRVDRQWADEIDGDPGDPAVVLVEHYSDGCTFGSSEYAEVKGIFRTRAEAEDRASRIDTGHGYFGHHINFLYFDVRLPS